MQIPRWTFSSLDLQGYPVIQQFWLIVPLSPYKPNPGVLFLVESHRWLSLCCRKGHGPQGWACDTPSALSLQTMPLHPPALELHRPPSWGSSSPGEQLPPSPSCTPTSCSPCAATSSPSCGRPSSTTTSPSMPLSTSTAGLLWQPSFSQVGGLLGDCHPQAEDQPITPWQDQAEA